MFISKVSKRYAQGILDFTQEFGNTDKVFEEMKGIVKIINESSDLRAFLKTLIIDYRKKIEVIDQIFREYSKDTLLILNLITRQGREKFLKEIALEYIAKVGECKGLQNVNLVLASELDKKTIDDILKSTPLVDPNREIKVNTLLDEEILGGYILRVGDQQVDESVRTKLNRIRKNFQLTGSN